MDCDYSPHPNCWMISEIPAKIKNLRELTSLRLTLTAISSIPFELTALKHLKLLDLTDGSLANCNLDNISGITSLEYLYLYGCGLSKLPADIGHLINLKELGLAGNNFAADEQARIRKSLPHCLVKF
jgi:Leucine-rich repeat (LRR) protein